MEHIHLINKFLVTDEFKWQMRIAQKIYEIKDSIFKICSYSIIIIGNALD